MRYANKIDWILRYVQGKKVLDLGCVDHNITNTQDPDWLHGAITKRASSVLGVDILQDEISTLKQRGYNVVSADVEKLNLNEKFEVIVAGDLIEHLSNPGVFLDRICEHLAPDGIFLLSTPNPFTLITFFQLLFKGQEGANSQHTCWFSPQVMNVLARRSNLQIVDIAYTDDGFKYYRDRSKFWWPFLMAQYLSCRLFERFSGTYCFVLQRT